MGQLWHRNAEHEDNSVKNDYDTQWWLIQHVN